MQASTHVLVHSQTRANLLKLCWSKPSQTVWCKSAQAQTLWFKFAQTVVQSCLNFVSAYSTSNHAPMVLLRYGFHRLLIYTLNTVCLTILQPIDISHQMAFRKSHKLQSKVTRVAERGLLAWFATWQVVLTPLPGRVDLTVIAIRYSPSILLIDTVNTVCLKYLKPLIFLTRCHV